ncbi:TonB-dependent receptor, partial [Acinetobacter baumannii]
MQRFHSYRVRLSVLAVAIAACSPAVQAHSVGASSDAARLASPTRPNSTSSDESQSPAETASAAEQPSSNEHTPSLKDTGGSDAPAADAAKGSVQTLDAMQVTGVRRANAAAVESKRAATNITDVISATDVRALP